MITTKDIKKRVAKDNALNKLKNQQPDSEDDDYSLPSIIKDVSASFSGSSKSAN